MFYFTEKAAKLVGMPKGWEHAGYKQSDFQ
jgi:hypothetical protein